jgi:hypothetical protein
MPSIFVISAVISIVYFLAKFFEMRFIEKESKPLKFLVRDTLLVYFSVLISNFFIEQLKPMIGGETTHKITPAFTDNPDF